MSVGLIAHSLDLSSDSIQNEGLVILPPITQETRIKIWKFHPRMKDDDGNPISGGFPVFGFPVEEPSDSSTQYAIKTMFSEWELPHVRIDLILMKPGEEVLINYVPLLNRGFPMNRDLLSNSADSDGYLDLPTGFGLKVKMVDDGYGVPNDKYGNNISIMGNMVVERDTFTAPITKIDATTSVTNTADGKTIKEGILPINNWELSAQELSPA
ncbi:MAG: hypothetical protein J7524_23435, partial [Roseofilum sp. Belize BBD 4]|uniref:hypothetical protein n=1 Tax=Roseofilum sp. Belize BBD 4 TaxID=2821500 RepID=UPI001AFF50BB